MLSIKIMLAVVIVLLLVIAIGIFTLTSICGRACDRLKDIYDGIEYYAIEYFRHNQNR